MPRARLYRPKPLELVRVEWSDAYYDGDYDGQPAIERLGLAVLLNYGLFVKMTRDSVVLASCFQPSNGTVRWFVTIPRVNIKNISPCRVSP